MTTYSVLRVTPYIASVTIVSGVTYEEAVMVRNTQPIPNMSSDPDMQTEVLIVKDE